MSASVLFCSKCGNEITHLWNAWHKITGWEHKRKQGGANTIALRKEMGELMCNPCMTKLKAGIDPGQLTL